MEMYGLSVSLLSFCEFEMILDVKVKAVSENKVVLAAMEMEVSETQND